MERTLLFRILDKCIHNSFSRNVLRFDLTDLVSFFSSPHCFAIKIIIGATSIKPVNSRVSLLCSEREINISIPRIRDRRCALVIKSRQFDPTGGGKPGFGGNGGTFGRTYRTEFRKEMPVNRVAGKVGDNESTTRGARAGVSPV